MTILAYLDTYQGKSLYGWAFDDAQPDQRLDVEAVLPDGHVVGCARAEVFRGDLVTANIGSDGYCSFKIDLAGNLMAFVNAKVSVRVVGSTDYFAGSPVTIRVNPNIENLLTRHIRVKRMLPRLQTRLDRETRGSAISIVMPVYNTPIRWLAEAINSVRKQWCSRWELICVDDGSPGNEVSLLLESYARLDSRIRVLRSPNNVGIAAATNFGMRAARYDYICFMDHDDFIEPHAVWRLLRAIINSEADLLYSDEVVTGPDLSDIRDVRARPAFSYDYYLSHPYFVHLICVRKTLAYNLSGLNETMAISADVDFVLRILAKTQKIAHIPSILYRWRTHDSSVGHKSQASVTAATLKAIQCHLDALETGAQARPGVAFNQFRVTWPKSKGRTLIVVPTKNRADLLHTCIRSIERTVDPEQYKIVIVDHQSNESKAMRYIRGLAKRHTVMSYVGDFNFSRMNNLAVWEHGSGCEFVAFINNDIEAFESNWLERLTSLAARPDIGVVGPSLIFGDRRIQHAGVIIGFCDAAEHVGKFVPFTDVNGTRTLGANCTLTSVRDFSAVTAACLVMRLNVFKEVNGFQEKLAVAFNDTDLCLRVRVAGYRVLYDGQTTLYHNESATRAKTNNLVHPEDTNLFRKTWNHLLRGADHFYHPMLSLTLADHVLSQNLVVDRPGARLPNLESGSQSV